MTRPARLVVVIGTATEVGKTWVGGATIEHLRSAGATVSARKPAQSFDPADPHPTDAAILAAASGEDVSEVCPPHRSYTVPMAPPMAAHHLGLAIPTVAELVDEVRWPDPAVDVGWLETVGGPRSPIGSDGDAVTVAGLLEPDVVVLVADAGLGTVNAVLVSIAPFDRYRTVVVLNRFDPDVELHVRNRDWLVEEHSLDVVTSAGDLAVELLDR
mgnify:FL=1